MVFSPIWREARVPSEMRSLSRDPVVAGVGVPHAQGQPVLLVPGYLAGDTSLATMTHWLRRIGYRTSRAGIRANTDCASATVSSLEDRLQELHDRYGQRVAIVGQSRGGTFARALAVRRPDLVSGIVTLGSPLTDQLAVHPLLRLNVLVVGTLGRLGIPRLFTPDCRDGDCCAELREEAARPFPAEVGFVSVYSRSDGVVDWRSCLDPAAKQIEVDASHIGMAAQPDVYRAIGRALGAFTAAAGAADGAALAPAA
jgi:triacylglycerol lipase